MAYGDTRVLMVCLGNICRSPMAEGILRHQAAKLGKSVTVDSAGTADYHVGEAPDHRAVSCMKSHGINISDLRARRFSKRDFQAFDIIFAMDATNYQNILKLASGDEDRRKVHLFLNEAWPGTDKSVPDPWFGDMDGFHEVFEMLSAASTALLKSEKIC